MTFLGLAVFGAGSDILNAVVYRVSDLVGDRVMELFYNGLIYRNIFADDPELHNLAGLARDIPHETPGAKAHILEIDGPYGLHKTVEVRGQQGGRRGQVLCFV